MQPFDSSHRGLQDNRIICPKRSQIDRQRTILNFLDDLKKSPQFPKKLIFGQNCLFSAINDYFWHK